MARLSPQVKEIIQIVIFLVVAGALVYFLWIYPLNRTSDLMERPEETQVVVDSLQPNDPTPFIEACLIDSLVPPDTFRVDTDGLTSIAGIYLMPDSAGLEKLRGSVIMLHDERLDRLAGLALAGELLNRGLSVTMYDQRASGLSSGKFHGEGQYEATDLIELIGWLELRGKIIHPLTVIGYSLGAEAALLAAADDNRIDRVIAVKPYLTTKRMQTLKKAEHNLIWIPFYHTLMWWWYNTASGYAAPWREIEQIRPVKAATTLYMTADQTAIDEVARLIELSGDGKVTVTACPESEPDLQTAILEQFPPEDTE